MLLQLAASQHLPTVPLPQLHSPRSLKSPRRRPQHLGSRPRAVSHSCGPDIANAKRGLLLRIQQDLRGISSSLMRVTRCAATSSRDAQRLRVERRADLRLHSLAVKKIPGGRPCTPLPLLTLSSDQESQDRVEPVSDCNSGSVTTHVSVWGWLVVARPSLP